MPWLSIYRCRGSVPWGGLFNIAYIAEMRPLVELLSLHRVGIDTRWVPYKDVRKCLIWRYWKCALFGRLIFPRSSSNGISSLLLKWTMSTNRERLLWSHGATYTPSTLNDSKWVRRNNAIDEASEESGNLDWQHLQILLVNSIGPKSLPGISTIWICHKRASGCTGCSHYFSISIHFIQALRVDHA